MSAGPTVHYEKPSPGVAWITLDRPHALNAINLAMRDELWTYCHAARADPDVRVLGFRGRGRAFCAGADVTEFGTAPRLLAARAARRQRDLWALLERLPLITLAALHGYCYGAGIELPLYCDIRLASPDTRIALPEVGLGYIPSAGGTQTLPRLTSLGAAASLILSGDPIDAGQARRWGLVQEVVPAHRLWERAEAVARDLAARDTATLILAACAIRRGLDSPLSAALAHDAATARRHRPTATG